MKILITGFEPFGESPINPSQDLLDALPETTQRSTRIVKALLPVDQEKAPVVLLEHFYHQQPDVVLSFGLALGRPEICLERVALNLLDFRIPDNSGVTIADQPVIVDGPAAYFTTLPVKQIHSALKTAGIRANISLTAGAFICNQVFYTLMHEISVNQINSRAGFIHLPGPSEQAARAKNFTPSLSLEEVTQAARIMIKICHETQLR